MRSKFILSAVILMSASSSVFAQQAPTKNCLIEEFTSSTCPPCKSFNQWFDPLLITNEANKPSSGLVVIKYQEDFPANPPLDYSYNSMVGVRDRYYFTGSWGIPAHMTNGHDGTGGSTATMQTEINSCKGGDAKFAITGTYAVNTSNAIDVNVSVLPTEDMTGTYKVHVATAELYYENLDNTNGQKKYYHVMRKMYPNANGTTVTSWTANTAQAFTFTDNITVGNVTKGGYNFWDAPYNSNLIVFVQDEATKEILQAQAIPATWPTNVKNVANVGHVMVYPNPATEKVVVMFALNNASKVAVNIYDVMGRKVIAQPEQTFAAGAQNLTIATDALSVGTYTVKIETDKGFATQTLTIVK
jgi:hypothetical protein